MSERIMAGIDVHFTRRMRNWARAWAMDEAEGYAFTGAYADRMGGARESHEPILDGEARDTDAALLLLPMLERAAVGLYWMFEGRSLRWIGRCLGCHHETVEHRIVRGHAWLVEEFRHQYARYQWLREHNARSNGAHLTTDQSANNLSNVVRAELRPQFPRC